MFGNRLKELREIKGISQRDLAKMIQLSPSTVAMYELEQRNPDKDTLVKLADLFNCSTDYLLGRTDDSKSVQHLDNPKDISRNIRTEREYKDAINKFGWEGKKEFILAILKDEGSGSQKRVLRDVLNKLMNGHIPIIGTIRAGLPILADENIDGYLDVPETLQADFALRVTGDSMTGAGILDGDLVICKAAETAQSGQIVVALHDQSIGVSDATLKYYYDANGNGPVLRPANPNYPEINMSDGYRIGGVMVGLVREDAPGYQVYKKYIAVPDHDDWTEVIELASQAGLKVNQVKEILAGQIEIAKKFLK